MSDPSSTNIWNQILEETLRSLANTSTPTTFASVARLGLDTSNNTMPMTEPLQAPDQTRASFAAIHPEISQPEYTIEDRTFDQMDTFMANMFTSVNNYHACVRQYHNNINQFNRLFSSTLRILSQHADTTPTLNTSSSTTTLPIPSTFREFLLRNPGQIEIQGISIPLVPTASRYPRSAAYPTITQILESTEVFTYNHETVNRVHDTRCPISLEDFEYGEELCEIRHCHHVFKWQSLQNWFSRNTQCPVCRYDIGGTDGSQREPAVPPYPLP